MWVYKTSCCEKGYVWNLATCNCENGKYLASIIDDSAIMCNEIIEEIVPINLKDNKANCKMQNFYILFVFLLITIVLLIAVIIYCYLITYQGKQKHLLPFQFTNNKLKEII